LLRVGVVAATPEVLAVVVLAVLEQALLYPSPLGLLTLLQLVLVVWLALQEVR
jgi:hypothetical protein